MLHDVHALCHTIESCSYWTMLATDVISLNFDGKEKKSHRKRQPNKPNAMEQTLIKPR